MQSGAGKISLAPRELRNVITLHIYTAVIILDFCLQLYVDVMETLTVLFKCFMSSSDIILC